MYRYIVAESPIGYEIYVNLISTSAGKYISRRPYLINLIKEVLATSKFTGTRIIIEKDMGRVIGNTDIVETTEKDTIYYALPQKKDVFSRFAKNRYPSPSHKITILLQKDKDGNYEIYDTWIGSSSPPFPGDKDETPVSKSYWENHALVEDAHLVQSKTITKICPY